MSKILFATILASATLAAPLSFAQEVITQTQATATASEDGKTDGQRVASWHGQKYAIKGYDVVALQNDLTPVQGDEIYEVEWDNTRWKFTSKENRELFQSDPERYAPQFGGFCPVALAQNNAKVGTIEQFSVVDQKTFMNYDRPSKRQFTNDPQEYIVSARLNW